MVTVEKPGPRGRARLSARRLTIILAVLVCVGLLVGVLVVRSRKEPTGIITVDELRPGQQGFVLTTLEGVKPARFGVVVLGIMRNARPQQDMVLVRLEGEPLTRTGVIMGMSGSPVYIGNRLAGAVAYTWAFAKEPIAGVTPIENMLQLLESPPTAEQQSSVAKPTGLSLAAFFLRRDGGRDEPAWDPVPSTRPPGPASPRSLSPLRPVVSVAGLAPSGLSRLVEDFERAGFVAVAGGSAGVSGQSTSKGPATFEPGSPMVVQLARGDVAISALGTVTAVVGDRVVGFGHPMLGQPGLRLPLALGSIQAVIPSQQISLKLWNVTREVGATETDGLAGLTGRLGLKAPTIPVTFSLHRRDVGREDTYNFELARHPQLTPNLLSSIAAGILSVGGTPPADASAHLVTTFEPVGYPPLRYDDWFSGPGLADQIAREVAYVPALLLDNPFGPVELKQITVSAEVFGGRRLAVIDSITLKEVTVEPGDTVEVEVTLVPYRQSRQRRTLRLRVPVDAPPGPRILVVGDVSTEARLDLQARRHHYGPRSLDEMMALLGEEFKQTRLYGRLSRGEFGVAIRGVALPALPASVLQILSSPLETDRSAIIGSVRTSVETPWVLRGVKAAYLRVTDDQEKDKNQ